MFLQPETGGRGIFQGEAGADISAVSAGTHHIGIRAVAEAQSQCINGNGFTGTGFTCDGGHTGAEVDF